MAIDKSLKQHYEMQGGVKNYLGKQKMVKAPKHWLSKPGHVKAKLAYITDEEEQILIDKNLYGSLRGRPNKGPAGLPSLQGGDFGSGGGRSSSGGGGGGGGGNGSHDRGGWQHHRAAAPKPAPAPAPAPVRDYESEAYGAPDTIASLTSGPSPHGDRDANIAEQKKLDIQQMIAKQQEEKFGPGADPTKFGETITPLDVAISKPENERTIDDKLAIEEWEKDQDWDKVKELADRGHSSDDIQKAMDKGLLLKQDAIRRQGLIERGLAAIKPETRLESSLLDTVKKTFDPRRLATNFALRKMGLSWLNPLMGLASLFFPKQTAGIKTAVKSRFGQQPKDMSAFSNLGLYADRQPTDTIQQARVGEGTIGSDIVAGTKGILESGQELLGLKGIEGHRADLSNVQRGILNRPDVKFSYEEDPTQTIENLLSPGSGFKGHDIKEAPATKEDIEKHYKLTAAHGGRIDKALGGRSRDI